MSTPTILIKSGRVIDPANGVDRTADVLVAGGKVRQVAPGIRVDADEVIDAAEKIVCPGLLDIHVHLREPGHEEEETIATGTAAALAGGFTSVACMPNTHPPLDDATAIEFVYRQAERAGHCNVFPIGTITKARAGRELAEMGQMVRAGAVGFSDDGDGVADTGVCYRAMQYVSMFDLPLIQHCQDAGLAGKGVMNAGTVATRLGLPGMPAMAEELMIQRDLVLAADTGARYHVAHVSTAGGVELVRQAKARGVRVTAEACPHHLLLTDEACSGYDPNYKMNPPLRSARDVEALIAGVVDGTIDCLVSDHAPHSAEEKELEFLYAPFGIIGLETALGLYVQTLIQPGHLDWPALVALLTHRPAAIIGRDKGTLSPGADGDVTVIDPDGRWRVRVDALWGKSRNCPYDGMELPARAACAIVGGAVKFGPKV